jgi:DNA mismatch repair protein MutH
MVQNPLEQNLKKTRIEILKNLRANLPDKNLFDLANQFNIPIESHGKKNKGWVGQTVERLAGLSLSNSQSPDGIDCELKTTTLISKDGKWTPKETIKVTQLNPKSILQETFETSILWRKLSRLVFVGVNHVSLSECYAVQLGAIDVLSPQLVEPIRNFWEDVQHNILSGDMLSFYNLGSSEELIQLRPVGDGKLWSTCPITGEKFPARAFYATKNLIEQMMATTSLDCLS